jgi:hypothetical protein
VSAGALRRLRILALGVVASAATFAACFSALALGFGRQSDDQLEAVQVVRTLEGRAFTFSRMRLAGASGLTAVCWNGLFRAPDQDPASAQFVALSNGRAYVSVGGLVRQVAGAPLPVERVRVEIALAGCTRSLQAMLARRMSRHVVFESTRHLVGGRYVDRYPLDGAYTRLEVGVTNHLPRTLAYTRGGVTGTSVLEFGRRLTPTIRHARARLLAAERQLWFAYR